MHLRNPLAGLACAAALNPFIAPPKLPEPVVLPDARERILAAARALAAPDPGYALMHLQTIVASPDLKIDVMLEQAKTEPFVSDINALQSLRKAMLAAWPGNTLVWRADQAAELKAMLDVMQDTSRDDYLVYLHLILESADSSVAAPFVDELSSLIATTHDGPEFLFATLLFNSFIRWTVPVPVPPEALAMMRSVMADPAGRFPDLTDEAACLQALHAPVAWANSILPAGECPDSVTVYRIKLMSAAALVRHAGSLAEAQQALLPMRSREHAWIGPSVMMGVIWDMRKPPAFWANAGLSEREEWVRAFEEDLRIMNATDVQTLLQPSLMHHWLSIIKYKYPELLPAVANVMVTALSRLSDAQLITIEARARIASYIREQAPSVPVPGEW